ncbi:MAG TPA: WD40 repeat domain-containing serine/threonine protein kinase [Gemmataceae bacterium]|jgi:serine/threonine protein kinase|nr:WD40 repeat domain-containing serine/threonine protein kinase [Gemmataceae bacterium]
MSTTSQLDSLVSAWQTARDAGREPSPAELCRDCPDLAPKLAERIALLRQMSGLAKDDETVSNPVPATRPAMPMPTRIGKYHILMQLGQGGMGAVYWAEDDLLRRPTAIKVLRPDIAARPGAVKRFLQEARAAATVEHEAIVPIWHADEDNGIPYLAMPKLRGASLADRLARGRLSTDDVVRVAQDVAAGLAAAHAAGLVHRDIKPGNIWLEQKDGSTTFQQARILDFGLARFEDEEASRLTGTGDVLGTPAYMAPEQARGEEVDARADLFSLGCVLYHAATGNAPFRGTTVVGTLLAVAQDEAPDLRTLAPELPVRLSNLIVRLMEKERDQRPASAAEITRVLATLDEPDSTTLTIAEWAMPKHSTPPPVPDPKRRSRSGLFISIVAAALVLLVGIGTGIYALSRPKQSDPVSLNNPAGPIEPGVPTPTPAASTDYSDLDRTKIPEEELHPRWQPAQLVAVVGGHAGLIGPVGDQTHVAISPDGKWIAWSSPTGTRIWDAEKLQLRYRHPPSPPALAAFAPDSLQIVAPYFMVSKSSVGGQLIHLNEEIPRPWRGIGLREGPALTAITFSRDARTIVTGTATGEIRVWDAGDPAMSAPRLIPQAAQADAIHPVRQLTFANNDRKLIALCHDDKSNKSVAHGWSISVPDPPDKAWTATSLFEIPVAPEVRRIGVHPNGNKLFIPAPGKTESRLACWDVARSGTPTEPMFSERVPANCIEANYLTSFGATAQIVRLWLGYGHSSGLWTLSTSKKKDFSLAHVGDAPLDTLAITPEQARLVVLATDGRLTVQNAAGKVLAFGPLPVADPDHPPVLAGNRLFTFVPTPQAWEVRGGQFVQIPFPGELKTALGAVSGSPAVSRSGNAFAWRVGNDVHVYEIGAAGIHKTASLTTTSPVTAFAWGADDKSIRTLHRDGSAWAWDLSKSASAKSKVGTLAPAIRDRDLALNSAGPDVFVAMSDRKLYRYSVTDAKAGPVEICKDAGPRVWPSPSGDRLLTDEGMGLGLWNAKTGQRIGSTLGMPVRPAAVQWAADEHHVLITLDGMLYVLRLGD